MCENFLRQPRCAVRVGDMGKRFDVLDKALETLNKLRKRQNTLPFVDGFSSIQDFCSEEYSGH